MKNMINNRKEAYEKEQKSVLVITGVLRYIY